MAYFVAGDGLPTVEQLRQGASAIDGAETVVFAQDGSFWVRVENPIIGEQFGFLSDVSALKFGDTGIIQNVAQLDGLFLYQVSSSQSGSSLVNLTYGITETDQVLGTKFPAYTNNSIFEKLTVTPGNSGQSYLPEFYLQVKGGVGVFDQVYGPLGLDAPYDGRALIVRGSVTGQRDAAWGNWLDTIVYGGAPPPSPGEYNNLDPSPPDFKPPDALLPLPSPQNANELLSEHIDYTKNSLGQVVFTDERYQAFKDVSVTYKENLISGVESYLVKKAAIATLSLAFPGAGWVGTLKTTWDVYSVTKPLVHVGFQSYLYQLGLSTTEPTDAQINQAFAETGLNLALKLNVVSGGAFQGDVKETVTKAGIKTFGAIMFKETNSFTYSVFDQASESSVGAIMTGGDKRDLAIGSLFADTIDGGGGNDKLYGFDGNDILKGGAGADFLNGGAGNDTLNGGAGADTMTGGVGDDTYFVDSTGDAVIELASQGNDLVVASVSHTLRANVERLTFTGTGDFTGVGNNLNNVLIGNAGNNILDGSTGADAMRGGAGNDRYTFDNAGDTASEELNEGLDTVVASVAHTLRPNFENLTITGSATNAFGSSVANILTGNALGNVINGKQGNDVLVGGAGADTFMFDTALSAATNVDRITDFNPVDDVFRLGSTIFAGIPGGVLAAGSFHVGSAAADASDRIIYDQATGRVFYDADGLGGTAQVLFAVLDTKPANLTNADFVVI